MNTAVMYERLAYTNVISTFVFFKHSFYEAIKIEDIFFIYKIYLKKNNKKNHKHLTAIKKKYLQFQSLHIEIV